MFYFTAFYGDRNSLLYYFYLSCYKVFLGESGDIEITDAMPINIIRNKRMGIWIHDFIAPFYNYIRIRYSIKAEQTNNILDSGTIKFKSGIDIDTFGKSRHNSTSTITIKDNRVAEFSYDSAKTKITATCVNY